MNIFLNQTTRRRPLRTGRPTEQTNEEISTTPSLDIFNDKNQSTGHVLRSGKVVSEPIPQTEPMYNMEGSPAKRVKTDVDIGELKEQYANNPHALQALEEHFKGLQTANESGIYGTRTENCLYSSYFFRKDVVDNFTREVLNNVAPDKISNFPLSSYKLYNADDILENISQRGTFKTRFTEQSPDYIALREQNIDKLLKYLYTNICEDINPSYAEKAVNRAIGLSGREKIFDIVVISNQNIETIGLTSDDNNNDEDNDEDIGKNEQEEYKYTNNPINTIDDIIAHRLSGVVGFIIVELGECKLYPYGYSINLICTNSKAPPGSGSILMGLYLYTIVSHPNKLNNKRISFPSGKGNIIVTEKQSSVYEGELQIETSFKSSEPLIPVQQFGILELASAYKNPGGLCMYEKFGFQYTPNMHNYNCFNDYNNLPMLVDFNSKPGYAELNVEGKKQKIINITAGIDRGFPKSIICSVRDVDQMGNKTNQQTLLGYLKSLKLLEDNGDMGNIIGQDADPTIRDLYYAIMYINEPISRTSYNKRSLPRNPGNINTFISYLESPPSNRQTNLEPQIQRLLRQSQIKGGNRRNKTNKTNKNNKTNKKSIKNKTNKTKKNNKSSKTNKNNKTNKKK